MLRLSFLQIGIKQMTNDEAIKWAIGVATLSATLHTRMNANTAHVAAEALSLLHPGKAYQTKKVFHQDAVYWRVVEVKDAAPTSGQRHSAGSI